MSKQSYMAGFCKKAAENKIDPKALARFAVEKAAADPAGKPTIWDDVLSAIDSVKNSYQGLTPEQKALVKVTGGALGGAALGTGIGAAVKGKKGLRAGSILGALGGATALGSTVDWNELAKNFGAMTAESAQKVKAHSAAVEAAEKAKAGAGAK